MKINVTFKKKKFEVFFKSFTDFLIQSNQDIQIRSNVKIKH